ncbi:uncharacterized protein LOC111242629 [Vigna radiata var. radiata]|uniref:Uncharacterized protein LOC111242629 n=1 Tax=Vigna radiata var. radiata TaxID=3916 RepID=A0A3Q0FG78_VIGRR|nr:uncharacterized protein LOC111242629 [Vigna radiata var. radiata]
MAFELNTIQNEFGEDEECPAVKYTLQRLITGLSNSPEEVYDRLLGRLMAYKALALIGRLIREYDLKEFISAVISIAYRDRNLQLPAAYVILTLVDELPLEAVTKHIIGAPELQEWFDTAMEVFNYFNGDQEYELIQALWLLKKRQLDMAEDDDTESDSQTESDNSPSADEDEDDNGDDLEIGQILEENNKNPTQLLDKLKILTLLRIFTHMDPDRSRFRRRYLKLAQGLVNLHTGKVSEQPGQQIWEKMQKRIFRITDHPGDAATLHTLEYLLKKSVNLASEPFKMKNRPNGFWRLLFQNRPFGIFGYLKQSAAWNRDEMVSSLARTMTFWLLEIIESRNFRKEEVQNIFEIFFDVVEEYFNNEKSQIEAGFLKDIFRRAPWIGCEIGNYLLDICEHEMPCFLQLEAVDMLEIIMKPFFSYYGNYHPWAIRTRNNLDELRSDVQGNEQENSTMLKKLCQGFQDSVKA